VPRPRPIGHVARSDPRLDRSPQLFQFVFHHVLT
jgi:hypothetical protein